MFYIKWNLEEGKWLKNVFFNLNGTKRMVNLLSNCAAGTRFFFQTKRVQETNSLKPLQIERKAFVWFWTYTSTIGNL